MSPIESDVTKIKASLDELGKQVLNLKTSIDPKLIESINSASEQSDKNQDIANKLSYTLMWLTGVLAITSVIQVIQLFL